MPTESKFMVCNDGHRCENDSICTENPTDEGSYYCDCDTFINNTMYAGLYCQNEATIYCTFDREVSQTSFCTNGGTCLAQVSAESAHLGCKCSTNYEGPHCQFVLGSKPKGWPYDGSTGPTYQSRIPSVSQPTNNNKMDGGIKAVIVLVLLGVVGAMVFYLYKKKMAHATPLSKDIAMGSELALEADGSDFHDSADFTGLTSTKEFSNEIEEVNGRPGEMI